MNLSRKDILLISIVMGIVMTSSIGLSYGQMILDMSCSGCVQIENSKQLELHRILELPIILWAEDYSYSYDQNSKITIKGHSNLNRPDVPIVFTVTSPIGNLVTAEQIMVTPNSDFKVEFNTSGPLWKEGGMYIIKAQAGPQSTVFKTHVQLISDDSESSLECNPGELSASGTCVPFSVEGGTVSSASFSSASNSLTININSFNDGTLTVNPSTDAIRGIFMVLVDGEEWDDAEINGNEVTVNFPAGTNIIEIIGTFAIPEFGSIAVLILVASIIAGIVLTSGRIKFPMRIS